jgi:hypothetical protein
MNFNCPVRSGVQSAELSSRDLTSEKTREPAREYQVKSQIKAEKYAADVWAAEWPRAGGYQ